MDNLILNNGASIEINEGNTEFYFEKEFVTHEDFYLTLSQLTEDNLSNFSIQNGAGLTTAIYTNKRVVSTKINITWSDDGLVEKLYVTFNLENVDLVTKALKDLKASQVAQNSAIIELATLVTTLQEVTK